MKWESRGVFLKNRPRLVDLIKKRSKIITNIRRYLDDRGLVEVETPILSTHREGGPFIQFETIHPITGRKFFLSFCPEDRLKRICSFFPEGVYEIARCFRAERDDDSHLSEFSMLEVKQPNKNLEQEIELAFGLIQSCALECYGGLKSGKYDFSRYNRVTCEEAIREAVDIDIFEEDAILKAFSLLDRVDDVKIKDKTSSWEIMDNLLKYFVEPRLRELTFLTDFPLSLSTVSRADPNSKTANRFQIILEGVEIGDGGEKIIGSSGYRKLYEQNAAYRRDVLGVADHNEICEDFLADVDISDPVAGFGIGIDRFVAILCEAGLQDVVLFPKSFDC